MATSQNPTLKFRPVLTQEQITYLTHLCHISLTTDNVKDHIDHQMSAQIRKVLVPLLAKIDVGAITPAYTISPESEAKREAGEARYRYENDLMSPEESSEYESKILGV
jgi:hypothetical protein